MNDNLNEMSIQNALNPRVSKNETSENPYCSLCLLSTHKVQREIARTILLSTQTSRAIS